MTNDGRVCHELLPNVQYDEARGSRASAYKGRYWLTGDHIEYKDETGVTAEDFRNGVLDHGGMLLHKEQNRRRTAITGTNSAKKGKLYEYSR